jgi:hypothetical protein
MSADPAAEPHEQTEPSGGSGAASEEELRAAYEAELGRITSADVILQAAVSLLNVGGRRLGLTGAPTGSPTPSAEPERDLEQVRDAIDGVRALLPILERRLPQQLRPLRDALAQLQMAYAREAQAGGGADPSGKQVPPTERKDAPAGEGKPDAPGPAESSGRLWVPGR